jgi:hypothetical protein
MQLFDAFRDRLQRRFGDMLRDANADFVAINADMASKGQFNNRYRIERLMVAIERHLRTATDWAFSEVGKLPGSRNNNTSRELSLPILTEDLGRFSYQLIDLAKLSDPSSPLPSSVGTFVQTETDRMRQALAGDLRDLQAGLWSPRLQPQQHGGATQNVIHIGGDVHGAVQQAGGHSVQTTVTISPVAVVEALENFMEAMKATNLDGQSRGEIQADAQTIRLQLRKASPDARIVRLAAQGIAALGMGVAGNLLTPQVQALLAAVGLQ